MELLVSCRVLGCIYCAHVNLGHTHTSWRPWNCGSPTVSGMCMIHDVMYVWSQSYTASAWCMELHYRKPCQHTVTSLHVRQQIRCSSTQWNWIMIVISSVQQTQLTLIHESLIDWMPTQIQIGNYSIFPPSCVDSQDAWVSKSVRKMSNGRYMYWDDDHTIG